MRECHGGDPTEKKNMKKTDKTYEEAFKTTGGLDDEEFDPDVYKRAASVDASVARSRL